MISLVTAGGLSAIFKDVILYPLRHASVLYKSVKKNELEDGNSNDNAVMIAGSCVAFSQAISPLFGALAGGVFDSPTIGIASYYAIMHAQTFIFDERKERAQLYPNISSLLNSAKHEL